MLKRPDSMRYISDDVRWAMQRRHRIDRTCGSHWCVKNYQSRCNILGRMLYDHMDHDAERQPFLPRKPYLTSFCEYPRSCVIYACEHLYLLRYGRDMHHMTRKTLSAGRFYRLTEKEITENEKNGSYYWYCIYGGEMMRFDSRRHDIMSIWTIYSSSPERSVLVERLMS